MVVRATAPLALFPPRAPPLRGRSRGRRRPPWGGAEAREGEGAPPGLGASRPPPLPRRGVNGTTVNVAIASGMKSAKVLLDEIREGKSKYQFIEIMGCPGGCINGGGQPYVRPCFMPNEADDILDTYKEKRAQALYSEDERQTLRQSHKNPQIIELYEKYLGEPNSHKAHELLHTSYAAREGFNDVE